MPRTQKLFVESLERRSLLAGDLMSSIISNTSAQADVGADQVAAQTDTSASANVDAGLASASTSVDANVGANLNLGLGGLVNNVTGAVNDLLATTDHAVDNALSNATSTVNNLTGNVSNGVDDLTGNLNSTVDDVLTDTASTAGDVVSDVQNTATDAANDLGIIDIIDEVQVPTTTVNNLLNDLGQVVNRPNLINELGLNNLPNDLTVGSLHGLNGLIHSGGRNLNGFINSLPGKLSHVADNAVGSVGNTAVVDSVFSRLGHIRHGLLR